MEITKTELKILIKEYLSASNRILRARYEMYAEELSKFVRFLNTHELIYDYIQFCGQPEYDVKKEVEEVKKSYGRLIFTLGSTEEKEIANIYAVIKYLGENGFDGHSSVYYGYSTSKKYQEKVNAFGNEYIRILITHIENYLSSVSIQMGLEEKAILNVNISDSTLNNAQVNVAASGSSISTYQNMRDMDELQNLIERLLASTGGLNDEDKENVNDCVETIETIKDENHKKGIVKMALNTLKGITGTAEFMAAVTAVVQFVEQHL